MLEPEDVWKLSCLAPLRDDVEVFVDRMLGPYTDQVARLCSADFEFPSSVFPVGSKYAAFSQILSGCMDADKCDYLIRDSRHTGIPVAVDVERIIAKMTIGNSKLKAATRVWKKDSNTGSVVSQLAIEHPAARTVGEVSNSRTLMFEKVYSHQKVLAAESVLQNALASLDEACPAFFESFANILSLTDNDFFCSQPEQFLLALFAKESCEVKDSNAFKTACRLLKDLGNRSLLTRCCAITQNDLFVDTRDNTDRSHNEAGHRFMRNVTAGVGQDAGKELSQLVAKEIKLIWEKLYREQPDNVDVVFTVGSPTTVAQPFDFPVKIGENLHNDSQRFSYGNWQGGRMAVLRKFYFFTPRQYRVVGYIACEVVLKKKYNLTLSPDTLYLSKIDLRKYEHALSTLVTEGYDEAVYIGQQIRRIGSPDLRERIERLAGTFSKVYSWENELDPATRLYNFIRQLFPFRCSVDSEEFLKAIVEFLEQVNIPDRDFFTASMRNFCKLAQEQGVDPQKALFIPIGNLRDSASHICYYVKSGPGLKGEIAEEKELTLVSMGEFASRLEGGESPLVFFDDAMNSGKQLISIFQELMGVPMEEREIPESHDVQPIAEDKKNLLQQRNIYLFFGYKNSDAEKNVLEKLKKLGLSKVEFLGGLPFPDKVFSIQKSLAAQVLQRALHTIGLALMNNKEGKKGWAEENIRAGALGYNDAQQMIVFPWNTPSYTVTALWRNGKCNGQHWEPLFYRS